MGAKAIEKAIAGGWKHKTPDDKTRIVESDPPNDVIEYWDLDWREEPDAYYHIIFNHDFAKALWGKERCVNGVPLEAVACMAVNLKPEDGANTVKEVFSIPSQPMFEWHLQQMVIADDPLD